MAVSRDDRAPAQRRPGDAPRTWIFYSGTPQAEAAWASALEPGTTIFWIHGRVRTGGGSYRLQLREGDSVLLLLGPGFIASGVLLADDRLRFVDAQGRIRRPVRIVHRYPEPLDRREIEAEAGGPLVRQGSVHPVSEAALEAINRAQGRFDFRPLPHDPGMTESMLAERPLAGDVAQEAPYILPDRMTAERIAWSGPTREDADPSEKSAAPKAMTPAADLEEQEEAPEPVSPQGTSDPASSGGPSDGVSGDAETPAGDRAEDGGAGETGAGEPGATDMDARIPYVLDAPSDCEDQLERGPIALFLARRLHLIWCQLNGHAPGADGQPTRAADADCDTFIVHVDSPWGGGKTTFANFLAKVLDPRGQRLVPGHFLVSSVAPTIPPEELGRVPLDDVFVPSYARPRPAAPGPDERASAEGAAPAKDDARWAGARRPWVIARYNAWRDQYVQPPWWQVFLVLHEAVTREIRVDAWTALRAGRIRQALAGYRRWAGAWAGRFTYQVWNQKLKAQFLVFGFVALLYLLAWATGLFDFVIAASAPDGARPADAKKIGEWIALGVAILGLGGASLATLFTVASQSVAPDLDFTTEHKQIGVKDPISRFRRTFDRIVRATDRPVLLIVDDLDRCDPRSVVELMRGFQTIIRSPRLFVLLLGDRAWIENAHDVHHAALKDLREGEGGLGARFVQKVIQLSFRLPTMKPEARSRFARQVLDGRAADPAEEKIAAFVRRADEYVEKALQDSTLSVAGQEAVAERAVQAAQTSDSGDLSRNDAALAAERVREIANVRMVASAGADAQAQRSVFEAIQALVSSLPNNPRQIKRIFMAFATYEVVGRTYFGYRFSAEGPEGARKARRWRQLAIWVTLAIEWPQTWRMIARHPDILDAAYGGEAARARGQAALDGAAAGEAEAAEIGKTIERLRRDRSLRALLSRTADAAAVAGADGTDFARISMEVDAVYEFNRIIWEPGFQIDPPDAEAPPWPEPQAEPPPTAMTPAE